MNTQELRKLSDSEMLHVMPIASLRKAFTDAADKIDQLQAELEEAKRDIRTLELELSNTVSMARANDLIQECDELRAKLAARAQVPIEGLNDKVGYYTSKEQP